MKISVKNMDFKTKQDRSLIIGVYENCKLSESADKVNAATQGQLLKILKKAQFTGKTGQVLPIFEFQKNAMGPVFVVGCGKEEISPINYRKIIAAVIKIVDCYKAEKVICYLAELRLKQKDISWKIKQITEATYDALYRFDLFKTEKEPSPKLQELTIDVPTKEQKNGEKAINRGHAVAQGVYLARNLANLPSNVCTPTFLADQARSLAKNHPTIKVEVLNEKAMQKLKMGAILGVSQGSAEEAQLICLSYQGTHKKAAPVALVGKGITFDTGGNSLKNAESIIGMKYDMSGGAAVLGTIKACAELSLPINVVGIIPAVENMPGGTAYKPDDILTAMSGQTIEIISTDAEGRLVLADALTYCSRYKPEIVIDIATLTGAVVIALGNQVSGLWANNDELKDDLVAAGLESNDRVWPMPLYEEYQDQLRSTFADMTNVGGRSAGAITAACFLSRFAKNYRWAHLDIAGTAGMAGMERAGTGRPIPLLMQYLINRAEQRH